MMRAWSVALGLGLAVSLGLASCSDDPTASPEEVVLLSVQPQGGSVQVDRDTPVLVNFDHAIAAALVQYAALHEGEVSGPLVDGSWSLSTDGLTLTFAPSQALKPSTGYTIHLGGGMQGIHGESVNLGMHGSADLGGEWATGTRMHGGGVGGGMDGGMGPDHPHMGEGWQHANGSYGMIFTFTTGD